MQITDNLFWLEQAWPTPGTPASEYAVFLGASLTPIAGLAAVNNTQAAVTYDDTVGATFLVRPTDGTHYGPSQSFTKGPVTLTTRAAVRNYVRKAIDDRTDTGADPAYVPKVPDDALNEYLNDAVRRYSLLFPVHKPWSVPIQPMVRSYPLPDGFLHAIEAKYTATAAGSYVYYLKEEPYKGGETTADSFVGFTQLGIITYIQSGRFYRGHFEILAGNLVIDFDPDASDTLTITYQATHVQPVDDTTMMDVPERIVEGLTLYVQAKSWLQIESSDVSLSRWRTKDDGSRRDDMPTEKMSLRMFNAWQQWLEAQRSAKPRQLRLVRRS